MRYILSLDIGTKQIRAIVYDLLGIPVFSSAVAYSIDYFVEPNHPEWASVDPHKLWAAVTSAISEITSKMSDSSEIGIVSVTGIGMDGLPVDIKGDPLYPIISWYCSRTEPQCSRWLSTLGARKIFGITGRQVLNIDSIYRIIWVKENKPAVYEQTYKWLLIEDYINFRLCGSMVTDYSMASTTSVFDQRFQKWSDELLEIAGVDKQILPDIAHSGTILGNVSNIVSKETGLSTTTKVVLGGHDYMCAAYSCTEKSNGVVNITGTWEMVIHTSEEYMLSDHVFNAGLKLESHVDPGKFALVGDAVSTSMIDWFRTEVLSGECGAIKPENWNILLKAASECEPGANGIFFLPHLLGAGCPRPDTRSFGAFVGLNGLSDKINLTRALIEGLNYQFKDMVLGIETSLNSIVNEITSVGDETGNSFYMQNKADISGKTIVVPNVLSASCLGLAMIAGIGVGIYKSKGEVLANYKIDKKIYAPCASKHSNYLHFYEIYRQIHPSLKLVNWNIYNLFHS